MLFLLFVGRVMVVKGQDENLDFCDMICVNNIYSYYCGDATCTTGASNYDQIFSLCTDTCASAVAGEVMMECLTTTDPDRVDWESIQASVLSEIVDFCFDYQILINPDVPPLTMENTDKELLDTLFNDPDAKEDKKKSKSRKKKKNKNRKEQNENEDGVVEGDDKEDKQTRSRSRRESRERATEDTEGSTTVNGSSGYPDERLSTSSEAEGSAVGVQYSEEVQLTSNGGNEAVGSTAAEERDIEEFLESDVNEVVVD